MTDPAPVAPAPKPPTALGALADQLGISVEQLARRLGVNRRTLYKWTARGCPWASEQAAREWCHHEGILVPDPIDTFHDLLARTAPAVTVGTEIAPSAPAWPHSTPAAGDAAPTEPRSPAAENQFQTAELRKLQADRTRMEIDQLRSVLVHRDDVARAFGTLGLALVSELTELPLAAIKHLPADVPAEQRGAVRKAVAVAIEQLRARLSVSLRERLHDALTGRGGA
jgi:phage terminase Nu1 subunit (DNA packaging protein)